MEPAIKLGKPWRKHSRSLDISDDCVEVAGTSDRVLIRDSKDPGGPMLALTHGQWAMLLERCRA